MELYRLQTRASDDSFRLKASGKVSRAPASLFLMTRFRTATEVPAESIDSAADEFVYSWVAWREACESVHSAYRFWATCEPEESEFAFEAYLAALDREEHAARIHARRSTALAAASAVEQEDR